MEINSADFVKLKRYQIWRSKFEVYNCEGKKKRKQSEFRVLGRERDRDNERGMSKE